MVPCLELIVKVSIKQANVREAIFFIGWKITNFKSLLRDGRDLFCNWIIARWIKDSFKPALRRSVACRGTKIKCIILELWVVEELPWNFFWSQPSLSLIYTCRFEGWRGFYKGLRANLIRVIPATMITFSVYENCYHFMKDLWATHRNREDAFS